MNLFNKDKFFIVKNLRGFINVFLSSSLFTIFILKTKISGGSKELNLRRLKKKNTSFFTDEDFNQVGQSQSQMNMVGYD